MELGNESSYHKSKHTVLCSLMLSHFCFDFREMISLFLLIFVVQDGLATEGATLRDVVNGLQMTVNEMNSKTERLENEVKVRVVLVIHES